MANIFFDIAEAQREAEVQPNAMADDVTGSVMTVARDTSVHPRSMQ